MMSLMTGVQRLIWYVCSVILSLRGTVYNFLRLFCKCKIIILHKQQKCIIVFKGLLKAFDIKHNLQIL